jgi:threonine aldolase
VSSYRGAVARIIMITRPVDICSICGSANVMLSAGGGSIVAIRVKFISGITAL